MMSLNFTKLAHLYIKSRFLKQSYVFNEQNIHMVVLMTSQLSFRDHFNNITRKSHSFALPYFEFFCIFSAFFKIYVRTLLKYTRHRFGHPNLW